MTPEEKEKLVDDVIRFYNKKTNMHYKCSNKLNRDAVEMALEKSNWNKAPLMV